MKKRKELDALLMNNMNVKKLGKCSGSGKEGHELLRNEASWDSNSTENDEFFATPRRLTIRKPPRWRVCATSVQLCVFVVMVACIVVTGGLVWMHLDLKQDLDKLRLRIAKVESELDTSKEQASTVSTLQTKIEQLQKLPVQISGISSQIRDMNSTSGHLTSTLGQLQATVKAVKDKMVNGPAPDVEELQKTTAQFGSTLEGVQNLQTQHSGQIETLTHSVQELQTSLTAVQGSLGELQQAASVPTPAPNDPTSDTSNPSRLSAIETTVRSLRQEQEAMSAVVTNLNSSVASLGNWRLALMPRIVALESMPHSTDPTDSALVDKVNQLQSQVDTWVSRFHSQTPDAKAGHQTSNPIESDTPTDWRHGIESKIQAIQRRLDQLNPQDLNNNLLNPNTTHGIQHQIERALSVFKEENLKSVDDLKQENQAIWGRVYQQHNDVTELGRDLDALTVRVQDLENETGHMPTQAPSSLLSTVETSIQQSTSDLHQPLAIPGISTEEDVEIKFFMMDVDHDNFLTYSELRDFLGAATPSEDQLKTFDKNRDDKLDLAEFKMALGFPEQ